MKHEVWTIPNLLSILRLVGVPCYFLLVQGERYLLAVGVLLLAGATDYLDGKIARRFNQISRLGELLDPAADRLYVLAILFSLWQLELIPVVILIMIIGRDLVLGGLLVVMKQKGIPPFKVTYLGKAATFNLLYAFPLLLLQKMESQVLSDVAYILGWAFSVWGVGLYLYTGMAYFITGVRQVRGSGRTEIELA